MGLASSALRGAVVMGLLLRGGLLPAAIAFAVNSLGYYAITDDWGAWYSQGPRFALAIFAALAAYGAVAASTRPAGMAKAPLPSGNGAS